tara:strand:- start:273 stop:464 length:192 start_codon:yes stop_codon:yes gene_type:complete
MNKYRIEQLDHKANYKMKALYEYFLCEQERANKKKQKRKQFITDLFDLIGLIFVIFITYLIIF